MERIAAALDGSLHDTEGSHRSGSGGTRSEVEGRPATGVTAAATAVHHATVVEPDVDQGRLSPRFHVQPARPRKYTLPGTAKPQEPITVILPVPPPLQIDPVRTAEAMLFPNPGTASVLYSALRPVGASASVVIRTEEVDETVRTTGGAVTLACSGLPLKTAAEVEALRGAWTDALADAGHGRRKWRFLPLNLGSLKAELQLPSRQLAAAPNVSANADNAEAVFVVELSEAGAQAWRQAIEADDPGSLVGSVSLSYTFAAQQSDQLSSTKQSISAPVGAVLVDAKPDLRVVRAEVGVEARLVVRGHASVERVAITLSSGSDVETLVLDSEGGEVSMTLATAETSEAAIDWTAETSFASASWPTVKTSGALSEAAGWAAILAPATWVRSIDVLTLLVDDRGNTVTAPDAAADASQISGSVEMDAPFLAGRPLHTSFDGRHQEMVGLHVPDPPGASPGELRLTIMALRGVHQAMTTAALSPSDRWVMAKVFPDARTEFVTNASAGAETPRDAAQRAALDLLVYGEP